MNLIMKKLQKSEALWIVILYFLLSVIIVSVSYYNAKQSELNVLSRGLYNQNSLAFMLDNVNIKGVDWTKLRSSKPFTLFKELETGQFHVRAVYFTGETYTPPIVSGRYFQEHDFVNDHRYAVVGKEMDRSKLISQNGKSYFPYHGKNFEIIGTMGASYPSLIDTTVLLNLNAVDSSEALPSSIYVLNTQDSSIIKNNSLLVENTKINVQMLDRGDSGAQKYLGTDIYRKIMMYTVIGLLISSSILFTIHWMNKKKQEIRLLWIGGISPNIPLRKYASQYYVITFLCYLLVCTGSYLIIQCFNHSTETIKLFLGYLPVGYGLVLLSSYCSILITVKNTNRALVREGIKR
ncbi:ABC transporter permease [Paenibacillus ehimensis]|uniref:ABC transporter permease n=1 Tax=Paenibacillus ehimensis TaxID=79264 RepID=UPI000FDB0682|nr:ABC transporter permease [Paenibacillus ehimensis]